MSSSERNKQWAIESTADHEEDTHPRLAYESPSSAPVLIDMPQGQDEETPLDEDPVPPPVLFADLSDVEDDTDLRPHTISLPEPDLLRCIQSYPVSTVSTGIDLCASYQGTTFTSISRGGVDVREVRASREDYVRFREVINLRQLLTLAIRLNSRPNWIRLSDMYEAVYPSLRLLRKAVPVLIEKQPSLPGKEKTLQRIQRSSWLYWYDPIDLVKT